jgi:Fur family peroxide stress response transcriptional regulator
MSKLDTFINAIRKKGLNVTYQRILIYKHLITNKSHPTADEIYQNIKTEYPSISLATVYKTLETLEGHNLVTKVNSLLDLARFDGDTSLHHHLICMSCKKIVDIYDNRFHNLPFPESNRFKVNGYRIQFEGLCESCIPHRKMIKQNKKNNDVITFCGKEINPGIAT